jgi:hypothetical protein
MACATGSHLVADEVKTPLVDGLPSTSFFAIEKRSARSSARRSSPPPTFARSSSNSRLRLDSAPAKTETLKIGMSGRSMKRRCLRSSETTGSGEACSTISDGIVEIAPASGSMFRMRRSRSGLVPIALAMPAKEMRHRLSLEGCKVQRGMVSMMCSLPPNVAHEARDLGSFPIAARSASTQ